MGRYVLLSNEFFLAKSCIIRARLVVAGGDPALIVLWADLAAGPLMFLHSGYGVGAAISPFLVTPFLSRNKTVTDNSSSSVAEISSQNYTPYLLNPAMDEYIMSSNHSVNLVPGNTSVNGSSPKYVLTPTRIQIPYMIIGVVCFVIALSYLIFQVVKTPRLFRNDLTRSDSKDRTVKKLISPESCTGGNRAFGVQILLLTFFFYLVLISVERAYGKFLYPYARNSKLKFNRSDAALLTGVYWISFTVSRMVAFIVAKWLPVHIMMFIEITGMLACVILLNVFNDNRVAFWVLSTCFGFFKSPLYPTGLGWLNRYMEVTSMVILVVNIGGATGGIFGQWLTGYLFQHYGPQSFLYTILVWTILVAVFFSIMHFIAHRHGDRFSNKLNKINTDDTTHPEGSKAINNAHIPAKTYSSINNDSQRF